MCVCGGGGEGFDHNFLSKNYHYMFLLLFNPEAFKTCKNAIKGFLPYIGLYKDRLSG